MSEFVVLVNGRRFVFDTTKDNDLASFLESKHILIEKHCGGAGICGACRCTVTALDKAETDSIHHDINGKLIRQTDDVLAFRHGHEAITCQSQPIGDIKINIPLS